MQVKGRTLRLRCTGDAEDLEQYISDTLPMAGAAKMMATRPAIPTGKVTVEVEQVCVNCDSTTSDGGGGMVFDAPVTLADFKELLLDVLDPERDYKYAEAFCSPCVWYLKITVPEV